MGEDAGERARATRPYWMLREGSSARLRQMPKQYDREYFDRWYRNNRNRVTSPAALQRKVLMVLGVAEYLFESPTRAVLDVGCGEAPWQPILARLRPRASYLGIDSSEYAVQRFGARRNIRHGSVGDLDTLVERAQFDLIVCSDVLHYVEEAELLRGLDSMLALASGLLYLEVMTIEDAPRGDLTGWKRRNGDWYRRRFEAAGLVSCGMQCYLPKDFAPSAAELETTRRLK